MELPHSSTKTARKETQIHQRVIKCFEESKSKMFDQKAGVVVVSGWDLDIIECDPLFC